MGDVGVVHQRQRLPLRLEASNYLARVHARLEHLQGYLASNGFLLLSHEDNAETALANLLEQLVRPDYRAGAFTHRTIRGSDHRQRGRFQKTPLLPVQAQQADKVFAQFPVARADPIQVCGTLGRILDGQGRVKKISFAHGRSPHSAGAVVLLFNSAESGGEFGQKNLG